MAFRCVWNSTYSVGDENLDRQHQRMFHLVNALPERLDPELTRQLIMFLLKHAAEHFSAEEERMKVIDYPRLDEHRVLHDELVVQASRFLQMRFQDDESVAAFKAFVGGWVINHILDHDMDYFNFERELRLRGRNRWAMQCGGDPTEQPDGPAVTALSDEELEQL